MKAICKNCKGKFETVSGQEFEGNQIIGYRAQIECPNCGDINSVKLKQSYYLIKKEQHESTS